MITTCIKLLSSEAARVLGKMPAQLRKRILDALKAIAEDPFANHVNVRKLQGRNGYRLRVGGWRVLYQLQDEEIVLIVVRIAPRGDVYK